VIVAVGPVTLPSDVDRLEVAWWDRDDEAPVLPAHQHGQLVRHRLDVPIYREAVSRADRRERLLDERGEV
jgi:hypothetical protein